MNIRLIRAMVVVVGPSLALDLFIGASIVTTAVGALAPPRKGGGRRLRPVAALGALAPWAYLLAIRPWQLRWGATEEEVRKILPGDDVVPRPLWEATRAITIQAPAAAIWPWLVQMGQGRGGLYTYDWLENVAGLDFHSADQIMPELQHLQVGDLMRFAPEQVAHEAGVRVTMIEPERALILSADENFSWAFMLDERDGTTRLIIRSRLSGTPHLVVRLIWSLLIEIPHFVMERKVFLGIKHRAERMAQGVVR